MGWGGATSRTWQPSPRPQEFNNMTFWNLVQSAVIQSDKGWLESPLERGVESAGAVRACASRNGVTRKRARWRARGDAVTMRT